MVGWSGAMHLKQTGPILWVAISFCLILASAQTQLYIFGSLQFNSTSPWLVNDILGPELSLPLLLSSNPDFRFLEGQQISHATCHSHSAAVAVDGAKLYTWGMASLSGHGNESSDYAGPVQIADFGPDGISSLVSLDSTTTVLASNGSAFSWGTGDRYHIFGSITDPADVHVILGHANSEVSSLSMDKVASSAILASLHMATDVASFGIDLSGNIWTWGSNIRKSTGTNTNQPIPVQLDLSALISPGTYPIDIVGTHPMLALLNNGSYLCWGRRLGTLCGDGVFYPVEGSALPYRVDPPDNIRYTKLTMVSFAIWALTNESTVFAWGGLFPDTVSTSNTYCQQTDSRYTQCHPHQIIIPGKAVVDIMSASYAFFAINDRGEIYYTSTILSPPISMVDHTVPILYPWKPPSGYKIDFSKSQVNGFPLLWVAHYEAGSCASQPPIVGNTIFSCINGIWTAYQDVLIDQDISLDSPIQVDGNVTVSSPVTITPTQDSDFGSKPVISVEGCVSNMELITMLLSLTKEDLADSHIDPILLIETSSDCSGQDSGLLSLKVNQPKSCKKVSSSIETTSIGSGRTQYAAVFKIDKSSCNTWWYALVGALGGAIIIALAIALLLTFHPSLRHKCRPFSKRSEITD